MKILSEHANKKKAGVFWTPVLIYYPFTLPILSEFGEAERTGGHTREVLRVPGCFISCIGDLVMPL
jgi:hypothetical protein